MPLIRVTAGAERTVPLPADCVIAGDVPPGRVVTDKTVIDVEMSALVFRLLDHDDLVLVEAEAAAVPAETEAAATPAEPDVASVETAAPRATQRNRAALIIAPQEA